MEYLKLSQTFIRDIFTETQDLIKVYNNKIVCPTSYTEKLKEPQKIIKLLYLHDNIEIILETLKNTGGNDYCSCEKYINECVNIYKFMKNQYCTKITDKDINRETCSHLDMFDNSYSKVLLSTLQLHDKLPSLESIHDEYVGVCKTAQINPNPISTLQNNPDTSQESIVKTSVGTMAGVSSVLALLYKVNIRFYILHLLVDGYILD
ncbi:hypothetical protein PCYB_004290 [Plasmodium cynomolgi strain B]|uniref:Uncharacterized protein n=1 Tax=Plasmodium cynomolgi (strain B) TaxID=1120755 RepID=K6V2Y8_PLACD|nr:hypothetical protein PCYB_004290 [Plasmodium cynomolgi strain B]GAB69680.1 hypothetical protein PCYB_004290 [Plasmodium cynomolgi strain B]